MAAGLADVLDFFQGLRFDEADLPYLRGLGLFCDEFVLWLAGVRFTGDVWAVPEGTVVFPNEPIVQVIAPIVEAQLVETLVLNQIHAEAFSRVWLHAWSTPHAVGWWWTSGRGERTALTRR